MPRFLMSIVGQSNERGSGPVGSKDRVAGVGAPHIDIIEGSWWPTLAQKMGARGVWLSVINTARGGTSITDQWVGRVRTWQSGLVVAAGSYVIQSGSVYRKIGTDVQTSTTTPTTGTGADGITWTFVRSVTAEDINGSTYSSTSDLFDPNGYISNALEAITDKPGYDRTGVSISIGQTDESVDSTKDQYRDAMVTISNYLTSFGHTVFLGMTCYIAGDPSKETFFQDVLLPGRLEALELLADNPLVKPGVNLRTELGVLTAGVSDTTVGLQADNYHLTSAAYRAAGGLYNQLLQESGW